jgi:alkylation response protein AidB-like acyl-CoA dehydrogenase
MGIEIEKKYGGLGQNFFSSIIAVEEISRVDPAVAVMVDIHVNIFEKEYIKCHIIAKIWK